MGNNSADKAVRAQNYVFKVKTMQQADDANSLRHWFLLRSYDASIPSLFIYFVH
jgi:hypothetical protein